MDWACHWRAMAPAGLREEVEVLMTALLRSNIDQRDQWRVKLNRRIQKQDIEPEAAVRLRPESRGPTAYLRRCCLS